MFRMDERVRVVVDRRIFYGIVVKPKDFDADILLTNGNETGEVRAFEYRKLDPLIGFESEADILRAFCRYEITSEEVMKHIDTGGCGQLYQFSIYDFHYALVNSVITGVSFEKLTQSWFEPLSTVLSKVTGFDRIQSRDKSIPSIETWLINREWKKLGDLLYHIKDEYPLTELIDDIVVKTCSPILLENYLISIGHTTDDGYRSYADMIARLCRAGDPKALKMVAEQSIDDKDWESAKKCYKRLYDKTESAEYSEKLDLINRIVDNKV